MTDKGVFYWGINSRPLEASSFVNLGKVSEFRGSENYRAIVEVLDRLYLTDAFGDLFVVTYNQQNRNFLAVPCGTSIDCRRVNSGIPFYGNRVLFVDSGTNRLYCINSMDRGMLGGVSEWECNDELGNRMSFDRVERFGNDYYVLGRLMGKRHLLKVDRDFISDNVLGVEVPYSGLGETGPITVSQKHPMHNFRAKRNVLEMSIFAKDLMDVEVGLGEKLKGVRPMKQEGFLGEITNVRLSGIPKGTLLIGLV